jgi:thioredoxin 1
LTAGSYRKNRNQHLTQTHLPLNIWFWFLSAFGGLIFDTLCCKETAMEEVKPINIGYDQFDSEVLKAEVPVLVDFWAPWCGPCRMAGPVLDKIAEEYNGKAKVCKVNVEDQRQVAIDNGIMSIPTLNFYKNGELVDQMTGVTDNYEADIKKKLDSQLE